MNIKQSFMILATSSAFLLAGCGHQTKDTYNYEVTVTNLTHSQPLSPIAVVLHNEGKLWQIGEPASVALEVLAESGDNSMVLAESIVEVSASGSGIVMPGMYEVISISNDKKMPMYLSVATMLVNTNDAFTGLNAIDISNLALDDSMSFMVGTYDSGTEANSEMSGSIPGPADGGEGYNSARDDLDKVAMHPGVVSMDDGLSTSVLTQAHKFDNPTLKITVKRVE